MLGKQSFATERVGQYLLISQFHLEFRSICNAFVASFSTKPGNSLPISQATRAFPGSTMVDLFFSIAINTSSAIFSTG